MTLLTSSAFLPVLALTKTKVLIGCAGQGLYTHLQSVTGFEYLRTGLSPPATATYTLE